ncbi:MAG: hemerythrin domain-containing protein [Motilibacteraceae bacterium]
MSEQTTDRPGGNDVISILVTDHREVEQIFAEIESTTDPDRRRTLADRAITELVRHSVAEEAYVYPAYRDHVPGGAELAEREVDEHAEAERTMKDLEGLAPTDTRFDELLGRLIREIRHHVAEEEGELFPQLRAHVEPEQLRELGARVEKAKKVAPTRPHPAAPDHPPLDKLLAPGTGLVDRLRDHFSHRGR